MLRSKRFIVMFGLGMALAIPAVAQASPAGYVVHPTDGSYGYVRADLQTLYACDIRVDGHRVRLHYTNQAIQNPDNYQVTAWAPSQGCATPQKSWFLIRAVRVCVEQEGCSAWKN
jgi:hypothetical protein